MSLISNVFLYTRIPSIAPHYILLSCLFRLLLDVFSDPDKFENTGPMFIKCPSVGDYLIFSSYLGIGFGASEKGEKVIFYCSKVHGMNITHHSLC